MGDIQESKQLISEELIQGRISQLAQEITEDCQGKPVTLICILTGAMFFCTELAKRIKAPVRIEVMKVKSYDGENSTGNIDVQLGLKEKVTGKDVIIVKDSIDSGKTLSYLKEYLSVDEPHSLKICTLLDKPSRRECHDVKVDYVGFTIENRFVIGFGLDYNGDYRALPDIRCFTDDSEEKLQPERDNIALQYTKKKKG